jgi:hypothetical protein
MPRPRTREEVWVLVEEKLGPLFPEVKEYMRGRGLVDHVLEAEDARDYADALKNLIRESKRLQELLERMRGAEVLGPRRHQAGPRRGASEDLMPEHLPRLLAVEAERDGQVRDFRARYLNGRPLPLEEALALLDAWAGQGRRTGEMLWVPDLGEGEMTEDYEFIWLLGPETEVPPRERRLPVTEGPLQELKELVARLTRTYRWAEAEAVALVMSGVVPGLMVARVRYVGGEYPVVLEVMPWLRAHEVAEIYAAFRQEFPHLFARWRMLSEKMLALALFRAENPRAPWRRLVRMWNEARPQWRYLTGQGEPDHRTFARDAKKALERLWERLGPW